MTIPMDNGQQRKYPMTKPTGHVPPITRYTARFPKDVSIFQVVCFGVQSKDGDRDSCLVKIHQIKTLLEGKSGPDHFDFSVFTDPQGYLTHIAVAYWRAPAEFKTWCASDSIRQWWDDADKDTGDLGYFREAFEVPTDYVETNLFKECLRGLSASPMCRIETIDETGYWGAARDRMPASGYDQFVVDQVGPLDPKNDPYNAARRTSITLPKNFCVIRSGVSWVDCGEEQLNSYMKNIKPKLDAGMEYLRQNPVDTGCCSLRQVTVVSVDGEPEKEEYSLGYFRSLKDLETWSHEHPTHLAIYTRAIAEREKYGDQLELRTIQEIYVLPTDGNVFEYINCHPKTGVMPYFDDERDG